MANLYRKIQSGISVSDFVNLGGNSHVIVNNEFFEASNNASVNLNEFNINSTFDNVTINAESNYNLSEFSINSNIDNQNASGKSNTNISELNIASSLDNQNALGYANSYFNNIELNSNVNNINANGDAFVNTDSWNINSNLSIFSVNISATANYNDFLLNFSTQSNATGESNVNFNTKNSVFTITGLSAGAVLDREIVFAKSYFCGTVNFYSNIESEVKNNSKIGYIYTFKSKIK